MLQTYCSYFAAFKERDLLLFFNDFFKKIFTFFYCKAAPRMVAYPVFTLNIPFGYLDVFVYSLSYLYFITCCPIKLSKTSAQCLCVDVPEVFFEARVMSKELESCSPAKSLSKAKNSFQRATI